MESFTIRLGADELADLRDRLARTRFAASAGAGFSPRRLREVVGYWLIEYDWPAHERRLADVPQFTIGPPDERLHFAHLRSANPDARAIILTHGWPYTFVEMLPLAEALPDFHVVVPSLPGFAFSAIPAGAVTAPVVAERWHALMAGLGYDRYLTYGEDVGAGVSDWLAALHPEAVEGILASHAAFTPPERRAGQTAEEEQWSEVPLGLERMLTTVMIYWISNSVGTSFRAYLDGDEAVLPVIDVPAAVAVQRGEIGYPRRMAERNYSDLRMFGVMERGGHFGAAEAPDVLAGRLREFVGLLAA